MLSLFRGLFGMGGMKWKFCVQIVRNRLFLNIKRVCVCVVYGCCTMFLRHKFAMLGIFFRYANTNNQLPRILISLFYRVPNADVVVLAKNNKKKITENQKFAETQVRRTFSFQLNVCSVILVM